MWNQFHQFFGSLRTSSKHVGCVMEKLSRSFSLGIRPLTFQPPLNRVQSAVSSAQPSCWRIILLGSSVPVLGQAVNATLLGTVTDSSGAPVGNAKMTITETNTGITHNSQTNDSGNYVLPDLPPGTYKVTAELAGFKRESRAGVDLIVNSTERVDFVLQPGSTSETITVEAETPILQTGASGHRPQTRDCPDGEPAARHQS